MSSKQLSQPQLGFVLTDGEIILKTDEERGHIEVAWRILNSDKRMKERFEKSIWSPSNPVDYLIYDEGAAKLGNRWGETRMLLYYPYAMSRKIGEVIEEYRCLNYTIKEVYLPQGMDIFIHRA